ncbi:MAG TPA: hypothetical protein VK686_10885 [Bryobacteraceae bacterium]|jgi:hypothetical protein|nr:hypothetical protein [Bryobacteraceae bacterium]
MRACVLIWCMVLLGCGRADRKPLQDLSRHEDLSGFKIESMRGLRDGDRLSAQILISDSSSILTLDLHFAIGSPTTLQSGTWRWSRPGRLLDGMVSARSVTFLGGQDGPPSIGGTFDLTDAGGHGTYRVTLPLTALPRPIIEQKKN